MSVVRRLSSIVFVLALLAMVACGHQVTPNPTLAQSDLSGDIVVKLQTQGQLDFVDYTYVIAIDSCGTGVPYPNAYNSGFSSYSFAILIGGANGTAEPELIQYYLNPSGGGLQRLPAIVFNNNQTEFVPNYNNQGTEFEFVFARSLLNDPKQIRYPCPTSSVQDITYGDTPMPTATPSGASASPSASPTATPTSGVTPAPSTSATPAPGTYSTTTGVQVPPYLTSWTFNMMVFAAGGVPADSLGQGGPTDTAFSGIIVNTASLSLEPLTPVPPIAVPTAPAYITYAEVDSYP